MTPFIGGRDEELSIVSGFDRVLYDAFKNALERGQRKGWEKILHYIQKEMIHAYGKNSVPVMRQLNWLPAAIYKLAAADQAAGNFVATEFASFFQTVSTLFQSNDRQKDPISEQPQRFYLFFGSLMNFYHYAMHHPDEAVVGDIIRRFKNIADDDYDFDTRFEIKQRADATQAAKKAFRDKATKEHQLMITQRQAALALIAWLTFLFFMEKVSAERFGFLLDKFNLRYEFFEDMLEDIDFIRSNEVSGYLGIGFWDYMDRPSGEVYSPPSAYDWVLYGPCLLLLRNELPNFDASVIIDDRQHTFLYDGMKVKLDGFKANLDKLAGILRWDTAETTDDQLPPEEALKTLFDEKQEQILSMFLAVKTQHEEEKNRGIASQPLNAALVNAFRQSLYQKWRGSCLSYRLFEQNGTLHTTADTGGLDVHGQSILLEHQKVLFIKDEQQPIYGSADFGAAIGRGVDERFVFDITREAAVQKAENDRDFDSASAGLDACIAVLTANGFLPDMIILPPKFFYNSDLVSSPKYKRRDSSDEVPEIGRYDGIPVLRLFAEGLKSRAIVTSFRHALSLTVLEGSDLYERLLHLDLRELTAQEIESRYEKDKSKWTKGSDGAQLSEAQAKLRLAASLMLEMWSKGKFNIIEPKALAWCRFKPAATGK